MKEIGAYRFSANISDNTGVTKKARRDTAEIHQNIINMQDACHELHLAVKDIIKLGEFDDVSFCFGDFERKNGPNVAFPRLLSCQDPQYDSSVNPQRLQTS